MTDPTYTGKFCWEEIEGVAVPFIIRSSGFMLAELNMLKKTLYKKHLQVLNDTIFHFACPKADTSLLYKMTDLETKLLDEINAKHCDYHFSETPYDTSSNFLIAKDEALELYQVLDVFYKIVTEYTLENPKCGFVMIDTSQTPVPFVEVKDHRLVVPLFFFECPEVTEVAFVLKDHWPITYLKLLCKLLSILPTFYESEPFKVVTLPALKTVIPEANRRIFLKVLPSQAKVRGFLSTKYIKSPQQHKDLGPKLNKQIEKFAKSISQSTRKRSLKEIVAINDGISARKKRKEIINPRDNTSFDIGHDVISIDDSSDEDDEANTNTIPLFKQKSQTRSKAVSSKKERQANKCSKTDVNIVPDGENSSSSKIVSNRSSKTFPIVVSKRIRPNILRSSKKPRVKCVTIKTWTKIAPNRKFCIQKASSITKRSPEEKINEDQSSRQLSAEHLTETTQSLNAQAVSSSAVTLADRYASERCNTTSRHQQLSESSPQTTENNFGNFKVTTEALLSSNNMSQFSISSGQQMVSIQPSNIMLQSVSPTLVTSPYIPHGHGTIGSTASMIQPTNILIQQPGTILNSSMQQMGTIVSQSETVSQQSTGTMLNQLSAFQQPAAMMQQPQPVVRQVEATNQQIVQHATNIIQQSGTMINSAGIMQQSTSLHQQGTIINQLGPITQQLQQQPAGMSEQQGVTLNQLGIETQQPGTLVNQAGASILHQSDTIMNQLGAVANQPVGILPQTGTMMYHSGSVVLPPGTVVSSGNTTAFNALQNQSNVAYSNNFYQQGVQTSSVISSNCSSTFNNSRDNQSNVQNLTNITDKKILNTSNKAKTKNKGNISSVNKSLSGFVNILPKMKTSNSLIQSSNNTSVSSKVRDNGVSVQSLYTPSSYQVAINAPAGLQAGNTFQTSIMTQASPKLIPATSLINMPLQNSILAPQLNISSYQNIIATSSGVIVYPNVIQNSNPATTQNAVIPPQNNLVHPDNLNLGITPCDDMIKTEPIDNQSLAVKKEEKELDEVKISEAAGILIKTETENLDLIHSNTIVAENIKKKTGNNKSEKWETSELGVKLEDLDFNFSDSVVYENCYRDEINEKLMNEPETSDVVDLREDIDSTNQKGKNNSCTIILNENLEKLVMIKSTGGREVLYKVNEIPNYRNVQALYKIVRLKIQDNNFICISQDPFVNDNLLISVLEIRDKLFTEISRKNFMAIAKEINLEVFTLNASQKAVLENIYIRNDEADVSNHLYFLYKKFIASYQLMKRLFEMLPQ